MLCRWAWAAVVAGMKCACVLGLQHKLAQVVHLGLASGVVTVKRIERPAKLRTGGGGAARGSPCLSDCEGLARTRLLQAGV